jgi:hypothetical protein
MVALPQFEIVRQSLSLFFYTIPPPAELFSLSPPSQAAKKYAHRITYKTQLSLILCHKFLSDEENTENSMIEINAMSCPMCYHYKG